MRVKLKLGEDFHEYDSLFFECRYLDESCRIVYYSLVSVVLQSAFIVATIFCLFSVTNSTHVH